MSKEQILSNSKLIEEAVANDEGKLVSNGAFLALTGSRTGRSPKDRFIVEEASTRDQIEWGNVNQPFNSDDFNNLWNKVSDYGKALVKVNIFSQSITQCCPGYMLTKTFHVIVKSGVGLKISSYFWMKNRKICIDRSPHLKSVFCVCVARLYKNRKQ